MKRFCSSTSKVFKRRQIKKTNKRRTLMDGQKEGRIDRKKLKDNYLRLVKGEFSQLCHEFEFPAKTSYANNSKGSIMAHFVRKKKKEPKTH